MPVHGVCDRTNFAAVVTRSNPGWSIYVPEIDRHTYAAHLREIELMARDLVQVMTDLPLDNVEVSVTCEVESFMPQSFWSAWGGRVGVSLPEAFTVIHGGCEYVIYVRLHQGRLVVSRIEMAADVEVTTDMIRGLMLSKWVAEAAKDWVSLDGGAEFHAPAPGFNSGGMTDAALDTFAQHYAYLMVTGQRPSGVFLRDYKMSRPTVTRWLNAAKARGILVGTHSLQAAA